MFNTYYLILILSNFFISKFVYDLTRTDNFWLGKGKAIYSQGGIRFFSNKIKGGYGSYQS